MVTTMSSLLLETFNHYLGNDCTAEQAAAYVAGLRVLPMPERISLDDWRAHVPMHLLERWSMMTDDERITVYVMAHCATHPYECTNGAENPTMN